MKKIIKNKKNIGIASFLSVVIMASGFIYYQSGFKELRKNDTESVFKEENEESQEVLDTEEKVKNEKKSNKKNSDYNNEVSAKEKMIVVEIKGEVKNPDVYTMNEEAIVKDLIDKAGGLTEEADVSNINRAKKLQNHEVVYINNKQDVNQVISVNNSTNQNQNNLNDKININTATIEELKKLNGIGDSKAQSIIKYREDNGGFGSIEDVKNVTGIGEKMFEKIKDKITT